MKKKRYFGEILRGTVDPLSLKLQRDMVGLGQE